MTNMLYSYLIKLKGLLWTIFFLLSLSYVSSLQNGISIIAPTFYTALSGDLYIQLIHANSSLFSSVTKYELHINRRKSNENENLAIINVSPNKLYNMSFIKIPCNTFVFGGTYELHVIEIKNVSEVKNENEVLRHYIDVRWPIPRINVSHEEVGTYPETPVNVTISFPEIKCEPDDLNNNNIPEFWVELIYCGRDIVCTKNENSTQNRVLYTEQIRGFVKLKSITLYCELFGLAGRYMVQLRPVHPTPSFVSAFTFIKADWNQKFVFNVHARSILPCDPHIGVSVLFEYPTCILDQADRIRLFAKLRADVASLKPPTSIHYITEQRVNKGQHVIHFECEYFSEKYIEYCFVYVSQAISGAVADIRMDCVPTLPVSESDTGGWGPWSDWTPCSTTCTGGTRNRYRFCDSPPPRYGAKFCEGSAVETDYCGEQSSSLWQCVYGSSRITYQNISIDDSSTISEIGSGCRCGCIVHLGLTKPKRILASSVQSCPGRSFWLIQADENCKIILYIDFLRLSCPTQYLKVRNGDSLASFLIYESFGVTNINSKTVAGSASQMLIEFHSNDSASTRDCDGGFLMHVEQTVLSWKDLNFTTNKTTSQYLQTNTRHTIVHIVAIIFTCVIILISVLLGIQYIFRCRKYHLSQSMIEKLSPIHTPKSSIPSMHDLELLQSRAVSTNTLFSEVIFLVKVQTTERMKHLIFQEKGDKETYNELKELKRNVDTKNMEIKHSFATMSYNIDFGDEKLLYAPNNKNVDLTDNKFKNNADVQSLLSSSHSELKENVEWTKNVSQYFKQTEKDINSQQKSSSNDFSIKHDTPSPASVIISTPNQKESKEKLNREKLLARPDSEFSLVNPEDLELDYYDYNVINAGAAPGSYLGMDPAYLIWVPPFEEKHILDESEKSVETSYKKCVPELIGKYAKDSQKHSLESGSSEYVQHMQNMGKEKSFDILIKEDQKPKLLLQNNVLWNQKENDSTHSDIILDVFNTKQQNLCKSLSHLEHTGKDNEKLTSVAKLSCDLQDFYETDDFLFADDEEKSETIH